MIKSCNHEPPAILCADCKNWNELEALRAENARLRAALDSIRLNLWAVKCADCKKAAEVANKALKESR